MTDVVGSRKDAHIDIVLGEAVGSPGLATGLGGYTLEYDALPEVDLDAVDLSVTAFGKRLTAPIVIGAMTGGTDRTRLINETLARAAARVGVGMALGSQRAMIARPEVTDTFAVREAAPDLPLLFGNIGAVQLNYGVGVQEVRTLVESVGVDVLNLHLNPLQEAIQPEGDTRFTGLFDKIDALVPEVGVPCVIKEVGAGVSARAAARLSRLPVAGIEVAGTGGTSWARVESYRAGDDPRAIIGERLAGFGIPTAESIPICRRAFRERTVIGSGGLRTGMDAAVALALGADLVALARPLLEAATEGEDAVVRALETLILELKIICFCTGVDSARGLRNVRVIPPGGRFPKEP